MLAQAKDAPCSMPPVFANAEIQMAQAASQHF
jgi:hypothetical protein